jgi:hypothetical protein
MMDCCKDFMDKEYFYCPICGSDLFSEEPDCANCTITTCDECDCQSCMTGGKEEPGDVDCDCGDCETCASCCVSEPEERDAPVYCGQCKYSHVDTLFGMQECRHPDNVKPDFWAEDGSSELMPEELNADNACPMYEPKLALEMEGRVYLYEG